MPRRVCQHLVKPSVCICVSVWSMSFWVRSCCVSDVMCSVCCVSQLNSCSCTEPLGTCVSVCACLCCCLRAFVYTCKGQTGLYRCHSVRRRKTLMLFHTDTYLTPLSLTPSLLQADICVLVCHTVTSHQTMAQNPGLKPSPLLQSHFSALSLHSSCFFSFSISPNPSVVRTPP